MTKATFPPMPSLRWRELWPVLTADQVSRVTGYGASADLDAGDVVFSAGSPTAELIVVESGTVDVVRDPIRDLPEEPVVTHGPGRFVGEFSLHRAGTLPQRQDDGRWPYPPDRPGPLPET
jgi:CRP-like cAMP-binding protein